MWLLLATLIVLNKSEATASLIDLDSGKVAATVPTGLAPHEVAVSPDGTLALATNYGTSRAPGSTLTLIDVAGARIAKTIELGPYRRPHGVRWLDSRRALVTAEDSQALLVVDVEAGKVVSAIHTGQQVSHMVAVTPDRARAFVANIGSGSVTVVDLAAGKAIASVPTGKGAEGIDVTPDGREVWIANREADTLTILGTATGKVSATLPCRSFPIRVRITPDGRHALVSNARSGDVAVFDVAGRQEVRRIALGVEASTREGRLLGQFGSSSVPIGIVVAPDGKRGWVAHANADVITVLDLERWAPAGTLRAGREPDGMAYSPVTVASGAPP